MRRPIEIRGVDYTLAFITVLEWHKKVGDPVKRGDVVVTYETQKGAVEVASEVDGIIVEVTVPAGEDIEKPVDATGGWGAVVGYVETEASVAVPSPQRSVAPIKVYPIPPASLPDSEIDMRDMRDRREPPLDNFPKASSMVRRIAEECGVRLETIKGSGPDGTITEADVRSAAGMVSGKGEITKDSGDELIPLTATRKAIAQNLEKSWREIPHAGASTMVDFSRVQQIRDAISRRYGDDSAFAKVARRWDSFVIFAMVRAIREHWSIVNSTFTWDGIRRHRHIDLGISYQSPVGLTIPVLRGLEAMDWSEMMENLTALYAKIKENRLGSRDFSGQTITFNNPGALHTSKYNPKRRNATGGTSIIPYGGGSAIVSLHAIIENKANLAIRFDHRTLEGAEAIGFLGDVAHLIENVDESIFEKK